MPKLKHEQPRVIDRHIDLPRLYEMAEKKMESPIPLITDKEIVPPPGDKRDFISLAPYWYRTETGELVNKDGKRNPELIKTTIQTIMGV